MLGSSLSQSITETVVYGLYGMFVFPSLWLFLPATFVTHELLRRLLHKRSEVYL